jgi:hypothetical protein
MNGGLRGRRREPHAKIQGVTVVSTLAAVAAFIVLMILAYT